MSSVFKTSAITLACAVAINLTGVGKAFAVWCSADAPMVYQNMLTSFMPFVTSLVGGTGSTIEGAVEQSGAGIRGELLKATASNKAVAEGIAAYQENQEVSNRAQDLKETMTQPASTCTAMSAAANLSSAAVATQANAFTSQSKLMAQVGTAANPSPVQTLDTSYKSTNQKFCTPDEAALGICTVNSSGSYQNLAGADHDAMFLFQSANGSSSFEGNGNAQNEATDDYIKRIVNGIPPAAIAQKGEAFYAANPQARVYVELSRRYNAMLSMPAYALNSIKELHRTQIGLGTSTGLATVSAPGFEANKADMSMAEAVERFVAMKFSPDTVADLAKATNSATILRDLAQMNNFELWMSYRQMQQSSRTEGLMAHQLVLVADQTLRPQLDAQRGAANRSASTGRQ